MSCLFFFFNDTATTEIYTLSLHDALPIWPTRSTPLLVPVCWPSPPAKPVYSSPASSETFSSCVSSFRDRKSTRLNSSHANISYAVFCLKKKNQAHCAVHRDDLRMPVDHHV